MLTMLPATHVLARFRTSDPSNAAHAKAIDAEKESREVLPLAEPTADVDEARRQIELAFERHNAEKPSEWRILVDLTLLPERPQSPLPPIRAFGSLDPKRPS